MLEIDGEYSPMQVIDDDCMAAVPEKFVPPNEGISRAIAALEEIELSSREDESLLSAIDESADLHSCFREAEELVPIVDSRAELSTED